VITRYSQLIKKATDQVDLDPTQTHDQTQHSHSQSNDHCIKITQCPTDPCAIYYTDAISRSILVICKDPKHTDTGKDKATEKTGMSVQVPAADAIPRMSQDGGHYNVAPDSTIQQDVQQRSSQ
jgi:hypothetical protein